MSKDIVTPETPQDQPFGNVSSKFLRPLCWARTRMAWPYPISGHKYKELPSYQDTEKTYHPLKCMVCGKVSTAWSYL